MLSILVIEDEASYVEGLEVALGREGFQVHSLPDGPQGLVGFREDPPDVVLLDLMLPGMSGLDVHRKITREKLLEQVWGLGWDRDTKTLDQHIRRLRRKLEAAPDAPTIETVRGVGYRLDTPNRS